MLYMWIVCELFSTPVSEEDEYLMVCSVFLFGPAPVRVQSFDSLLQNPSLFGLFLLLKRRTGGYKLLIQVI